MLQEQSVDTDNVSLVFSEAFGRPFEPSLLRGIVPSEEAKNVLKEWYERQRAQLGVSTEIDFRNARQ